MDDNEIRGYNFENLRRAVKALDNHEQINYILGYIDNLEQLYADKITLPDNYGLERFIAVNDFTFKGKQHKRGDIVLITAKEVADKGFIALGYLKREAK